MIAYPGESVIGLDVMGDWQHEAHAVATLQAAAHLVCTYLVPIESSDADTLQFAVCLETGVPAVLGISVLLALAHSQIEIRVPAAEVRRAERTLEKIRNQALTMTSAPLAGRTDNPF